MKERAESLKRDLPPLLVQFLSARGFDQPEEIEKFLYPRLADIPNPKDQLLDLDEAVRILLTAREQRKEVLIFGDYDVDGATSTALLTSSLRALGWQVNFFIPHRVKEGYGITEKAVTRLRREHPKAEIVVSCDCGVASFEGIQKLRDQNVQVIVTDHHEVPETRVPAHAVINPKQKNCPYPEKKLAGVGVAFLLLIALRQALNAKDFSLLSYLDLVALGTVCDLAELKSANRSLVKAGLQVINSQARVGIACLKEVSGNEAKDFKAIDLGFILGPRLNAAGRVGDPTLGVRLLLASNRDETLPLALELETMNQKRRSLQAEQTELALEMAKEKLKEAPSQKSLILYHEDFHLGLVGLIASRLTENFKKPSCVLTKIIDEHALADFHFKEDILKGSLRTPVGYHLAEALQSIQKTSPNSILHGGGHAMAAGVSLLEAQLKSFSDEFESQIQSQGFHPERIDFDLELKNSPSLDGFLDWLEPIGQGNPAPRFLIRDFQVQQKRVLKEEHLKLKGRLEGREWAVLQFRSPWVKLFESLPESGLTMDFVGEILENEWQGRRSVEWKMKEVISIRNQGVAYDIQHSSYEIRQSKSS